MQSIFRLRNRVEQQLTAVQNTWTFNLFYKDMVIQSMNKQPVGYTAALSSNNMFLLLSLLISMLCLFFPPVNNTISSFKILRGSQTQQSLLLILKLIYITCIKMFPIFIADKAHAAYATISGSTWILREQTIQCNIVKKPKETSRHFYMNYFNVF